MTRIDELLKRIELIQQQRRVLIVETGTIRNVDYQESDGHSTRFIAEMMRKEDLFISIDLYTEVCEKYLRKLGLRDRAIIVQSDSVKYLKYLCEVENIEIDVAYLDSENDASLIFDEFQVVWNKITKGGFVAIDDAYPESEQVYKCHKVLKWANENNVQYEIINNQMFITK